jgi:trk system potassium uptake protein TrkH
METVKHQPETASPLQRAVDFSLQRFRRLTPQQILVLGFLFVIAVGTILLSLPVAVKPGGDNTLINALFTATSATCVVGLVVVDTGTNWSSFGQLVILSLIKIGGMGFMAVATLILVLSGRRISFKHRLLIQESLSQTQPGGIVGLVLRVIAVSLTVELLFTLVFAVRFVPEIGWGQGLWLSVFHSISAFNNAGFDLMGGFRSLTAYAHDIIVNIAVAVPVILGGLGFVVLLDYSKRRSFRRLSLHSKVVLAATVFLILSGALTVLLIEYNRSFAHMSIGGKVLASFFQAITSRSAGFSTVATDALHPATQLFTIGLMFIGGGPASVTGGIKVTAFAILLLSAWNQLRGREDISIAGRRVPEFLVYKAIVLTVILSGLVILATLTLSLTEQADFLTALFEATSAIGIVGLSMGLTPDLSPAGKVVVTTCMFIGRVGPLTAVMALVHRHKKSVIKHPEEAVILG